MEQGSSPYTVVLNQTFLDECWAAWKTRHNAVYADQEEEKHRRQRWMNIMVAMMKHNIQYDIGQIAWTMGLNQFSARLPGEPICGCCTEDALKSEIRGEKQEPQSFASHDDNSISFILEQTFLDECWSRWKQKHNKVYANQQEENQRREKWTVNLVDIMKNNVKHEVGVSDNSRRLDQFADSASA
ncbi:hypothetical protein D915_006963 [Fasciola hepatica]|uniref:Cathepsin propeptide inhibitor domain-containing protein n=1 Tax=Fasciola hepatica TaxID=6192 RepID=A0A2H1C4L9_FASHE|nr:hypothetical protein D915_006963 [Fasciola hepatica]